MRKHEKMIIYNLFPLLAGKFTHWERHFARISKMGFNWIFVNPVQFPGFSGSIYSIKDFFRFNPLLIDETCGKTPREQMTEAILKAEEFGLKLMSDLVINHCAVDSDLVEEHPEWFQWKGAGKVAHPSCDENGKRVVWGDLAKFDHTNTRDKSGLFQFFFQMVTFMVEMGFKGFRCDAAYQVPGSFWERLIRETKTRYPDVLFFAETLGCPVAQAKETAKASFDYIFNSSKWWDFHGCWLLEQYHITRKIAPSISFPESHDTLRLCEEFHGNIGGMKQRYLFSALFSTGVMMLMGFEFGFRKKVHVVKTREEDWEKTDMDLTRFIMKVNKIKERHSIFQEDAPTQVLRTGNANILLMRKSSNDTREESLIILNKDIFNKQSYYADSLYAFIRAGATLIDVSPDYPLDYIPEPFSYNLRPGQGIVLTTSRNNT